MIPHDSDESEWRTFEQLGKLLGEAKKAYAENKSNESRDAYLKALREFADFVIRGKIHKNPRPPTSSLLEISTRPARSRPAEVAVMHDPGDDGASSCPAKRTLQHRLEVALKDYSRSASVLTAYIHSQWELQPALEESNELFDFYQDARKQFDEHVSCHGC